MLNEKLDTEDSYCMISFVLSYMFQNADQRLLRSMSWGRELIVKERERTFGGDCGFITIYLLKLIDF